MNGGPPAGQAPAPRKVVQIHRSLACNLTCAHCYSSSGPAAAAGLDSRIVRDAIDDARALGYEAVSFSGGEPLIDPQFPVLARHAHGLGMPVTVTTNGTVLTDRRLAQAAPWLAGVAVSVDGPPEQHNQLRGTPRAFLRMQRGLAALRRHQLPFGVIHTLTASSIQHLPWLADFALGEGARLLHIHPLELTGRAAPALSGDRPHSAVLERAYLTSIFLAAAHRGELAVHFDALTRAQLLDRDDLLLVPSGQHPECGGVPRILVIEPDGAVVPLAWGMSRRHLITSLPSERLAAGFPRWLRQGRPGFESLGRQVLRTVEEDPDLSVINWLELLVSHSRLAEAEDIPLMQA